jgi:hypothetical protein
MTFSIFQGAFAPDVVDVPAGVQDVGAVTVSTIDLAALFGLDRLPDRRLVCRWQRDNDGRIACHWEPDIVPDPQR